MLFRSGLLWDCEGTNLMPATRTLPQVKSLNTENRPQIAQIDSISRVRLLQPVVWATTTNTRTYTPNQPLIPITSAANQKLPRIPSCKSDRPGHHRENLAVANQSSPTKTLVARKSQPPASTNHTPALTALNSSLQPLAIAFRTKFPDRKSVV